MANEQTMWGLHAGRTGDADTLFLKKNLVAVGWDKLGDLSGVAPNQEAFKAVVAKAYPEAKPGAVPNIAGQLLRFVHTVQPGDLILYPSKTDKQVHYGRVTGEYRYDPSLESGYPNLRPVKWEKAVPRTSFSQGALYEIGSAMSLFQVKNYADEFAAALKEGDVPPPGGKADQTVAPVAEDVEQNTRDFVLKTLAQELKGHPLSHFVAHLLGTMGYRTRVSPEGPDGGIDVIAHRDELGFEPPIIKVQVKGSEGKIGQPVVASLYGNVASNEHGLLVTLGGFTAQAVNFARNNSNLRLVDGEELVDLVLAHYEQFDSQYKGVLPLKKVYIPQPITE